jgi:hypothetical protein
MFREASCVCVAQAVVLAVALLACPHNVLAQRGAGGHVGGGLAGGGSMTSGSGRSTGVDAKDDLRDFHAVLAVQASHEQIAAFALMTQSTNAAITQVQEFAATLGTNYSASALAGHDKTVEDAVESARLLDKNFLKGFSEKQKTGLKEIIKRLGKTDSEVAQQAKAVDRAVEVNAGSSQIAGTAQNLDHALTDFQRAETDLGEEMSIPAATLETSSFSLIPIKSSITVASRSILVTTSRTVTKTTPTVGQNAFSVELTSNLSDLQLSLADVLRAQLDNPTGCGERIAIQSAELTSRGAAAIANVQLHFERWACTTVMGRETMNEIVESNGSVEVILVPEVAEDGQLRLKDQTGNVRAEGLMAESLRTGSLGEALRGKIARSLLTVLRQCGDFRAALPAGTGNSVTLKRAQFQGTGSGRLAASFDGEINVSAEQLQALKGEQEAASAGQTVPGPLLPRPVSTEETTPR